MASYLALSLLVMGALWTGSTTCLIGREVMKGELFTPGSGCMQAYMTVYSSLDESCYCDRDLIGNCPSDSWCKGSLAGDGSARMLCYYTDPKCNGITDQMFDYNGSLGVCYSSYRLTLTTTISPWEIVGLILCSLVALSIGACALARWLKRTKPVKNYRPVRKELEGF